jgi:WD40 repeat protein
MLIIKPNLKSVFRFLHPLIILHRVCKYTLSSPFFQRHKDTQGICLEPYEWVQFVSGGRLYITVIQKLLSMPGQQEFRDFFRHGNAMLSRRNILEPVIISCSSSLWTDSVSDVKISPDGNHISICAGPDVLVKQLMPDKTVSRKSVTFNGPYNRSITCCCWHPVLPILAVGNWDTTAKLWIISPDGKIANCIATLSGHTDSISSIAFDPNGRFIATGSWDNTAKVWSLSPDCTVVNCVATLVGHSCIVESIAIHPRGNVVATGSADKTVRLWQLSGDFEKATCQAILGEHNDRVLTVEFDPNGQFLVTRSMGTPKLWRLFFDGTAAVICEDILMEDDSPITSMCFSRTQEPFLITGSHDGIVKIWSISPNGTPSRTRITCVATLDGHQDRVVSIDCDKTGNLIVTGSCDDTIKFWK